MTQEQLNQAELHDPQNYYMWIFYFSRNGTRFVVPKRIGYGWTFNFGRCPNMPLALFWAFVGVLATLAVAPYLLALNTNLANNLPMPVSVWASLQAVAMGTNVLFLGWLGLRLGQRMGLDSPIARSLVLERKRPLLSLSGLLLAPLIGVVAGFLVLALDVAFQPYMPAPLNALGDGSPGGVSWWKGLLASFYGGITEELLCRLFLMTLMTWLIWKTLSRRRAKPPVWTYAVGVVVAAVLFGVGHLPAAVGVFPLTPMFVTKIILLNTILGVSFGLIYWKRGLEYAMLAHFCADIVLHVLIPVLLLIGA